MVRTVITPDNRDLSIHIPEDYVGRQIEVLLYDFQNRIAICYPGQMLMNFN